MVEWGFEKFFEKPSSNYIGLRLKSNSLEKFQKELLKRLQELEESEKTTREDHETVQLDQTTQGRLSRMDAMQVQAMALETKRRRELGMFLIKAALKRIEEEEFGWCLNCGEEIAFKRLEWDPSTPNCIDCAR